MEEMMKGVGWCSSHSNGKVRTKRLPRKEIEFNCKHKQSLESRQKVFSPTFHFRKRRRKSVVDVGACPYNLRTPTTALVSENSCVILSDSEDEDQGFDKGNEATRHDYATMAINEYNDNQSSSIYEIVETGPLAAGYLSTGCRIFHFNFKAKLKHNPDAPLLTFFSEFTKTIRNVVTLHRVKILGPSHLLQEKANTCGCLYCYSLNIHHPYGLRTFRRGDDHLWTTLCSQIKELNTYIEEGKLKEEALFIPKFLHPGVKYRSTKDITRADVALQFFNEKEGTNFELVKEGLVVSNFSGIGLISHLNFEAKNKNESDLPVQTFFTQVFLNQFVCFTEFCKCLGPSDSLPDKPDLQGCLYCATNHVHHPPGPGYLTGQS